MIKACILTPLVMLLVLLQPAAAQQSMNDVFAQMEPADESVPAEGTSPDATDADRLEAILQKGMNQYDEGNFQTAVSIFDAVLAIDEYNSDALSYKKRALNQIGKRADVQKEATRADAYSELKSAWNKDPLAYGGVDETERAAESDDSGQQAVEEMESRLKAIRIPVFDMAEATVQEVVQFFAEASRSRDGSGEDVDILLVGMEESSEENNITVSVDDISLYEALQYVVEMASLKFEIKQNLVIIMPVNYVPASKMVMKSFNIVPEVGSDMVSATDPSSGTTDLFDAPAAGSSSGPVDVSGFFSLVDFPEGSSAVYQERFQKLFVRNTPVNLKAVETVLDDLTEKAIQRRSQQVEIEAKFVEFSEGALSELGFDWTVYGDGSILGMEMDDGQYYQNRNGYRSPTPPQPPPPTGNNDAGEPQLTIPPQNTFYYNPVIGAKAIESPDDRRAQNFFAAHQRNNTTAFDTADIGILSTIGGTPAEMFFGNGDVDLRITAMEQEGTADVLSTPRVTTKSGAEAFIRVAETHRYPQDWEPESGQSTAPIIRPQDWTDFDLGVALTVTPVADVENGTIELDLSPEILVFKGFDLYKTAIVVHDRGGNDATDIVGGGQSLFAQMVAIERRNVRTQVVVADGSTIVMGGLVNERTETFRDQVPFIGDIPYLGRLFRAEGSRTEKRNLTIFVKASMVDTRGMTRADRELARR